MTIQPAADGSAYSGDNNFRAVVVLLPDTTEKSLQSLIDSVRASDGSSEVLLLDGTNASLREKLSALTRASGHRGSRAMRSELGTADEMSALTSRERQVLALLAEGQSNSGIAESLSISQNTVRAHLRSVMQKLNVANRVQAAAAAMRAGLHPNTG